MEEQIYVSIFFYLQENLKLESRLDYDKKRIFVKAQRTDRRI